MKFKYLALGMLAFALAGCKGGAEFSMKTPKGEESPIVFYYGQDNVEDVFTYKGQHYPYTVGGELFEASEEGTDEDLAKIAEKTGQVDVRGVGSFEFVCNELIQKDGDGPNLECLSYKITSSDVEAIEVGSIATPVPPAE